MLRVSMPFEKGMNSARKSRAVLLPSYIDRGASVYLF
jgi:hypothetical protein